MKNTKSSGLGVRTFKKRTAKETVVQVWLRFVLVLLLGVVLPGAKVYGGYSPFGIGLVAAVSGPYSVPVFFSTVVGYAVWGGANSLRYMASIIAVIGMKWSISGFPQVLRSSWLAPILSFLCTLITGSALLLSNQQTAYDVLLIVSESLLAAGFSYFVSASWKTVVEGERVEKRDAVQAGMAAMIAVIVMALFSLEWEGISLGRIAAVLCTLLASRYFGLAGGCIGGSLFGLVSLLSNPSDYFLLPIFSFGGLLAGLFSKRGRLVSAVSYAAVTVIVYTVFRQETAQMLVTSLYEILVACVLVYGVPTSVEQRVKRVLFPPKTSINDSHTTSATQGMSAAADAMERITATVDTVSKQMSTLSAPEIGGFYRNATAKVCDECKRRWECWDGHFSQVMDSFNHVTAVLEQGETLSPTAFDGYLKENCHRLSELCARLNSGYGEFSTRQIAFGRLQELRGVITDQFSNTAQILRDFSCRFSNEIWEDAAMEDMLKRELKNQDIPIISLHCRIRERECVEIDLKVKTVLTPDEAQLLCEDLSTWCNRTLSVVTVEGVDNTTTIRFAEGITFCISLGVSQLKCKGEHLCGDAFELFQDPSGRFYAILSDGMGCGGRAAVDGAMTAGLAAQLLQAGFGYESVLRLANTALMAKSGDETLATLDIAAVDLYSGEIELLKAGAGVSLLLSHGCVSRFEESSLPLGILREISFSRSKDRLVAGDILVMMSDGVSNGGVRWVEELLRNFDTQNGDVQKLADNITQTAQRMCKDEKGDDITAVILKLEAVL